MLRVRLAFAADIEAEGVDEYVRRSWYAVPAQLQRVGDFHAAIRAAFVLPVSSYPHLSLSVDGFVLPPGQPITVLREDDLVCVDKEPPGTNLPITADVRKRSRSIEPAAAAAAPSDPQRKRGHSLEPAAAAPPDPEPLRPRGRGRGSTANAQPPLPPPRAPPTGGDGNDAFSAMLASQYGYTGMGPPMGGWGGDGDEWGDSGGQSLMEPWQERVAARRAAEKASREADEEEAWPWPLFAPRHRNKGEAAAEGGPSTRSSGGPAAGVANEEAVDYEAMPAYDAASHGQLVGGDSLAFRRIRLDDSWTPVVSRWLRATVVGVMGEEEVVLTLRFQEGDGEDEGAKEEDVALSDLLDVRMGASPAL